METSENKEANLEAASRGVKECVLQGANVVVLPEIFNSPYETKKFREYSEEKGGKTWTFLSNLAKENKIILVGGSFPELEDDKVYNTSFIFDDEGKQIGRHRKMHLFDIDVKGGQRFKESDALTAGDSVCVFNTRFCKIGVCICFDMRFPELSRLMVQEGAEVIIVPAAFNMTTGPAHWDLMFRQRAVDNQCFTVGVAPARNEKSSYVSYANSIVVGPWGNVVYHADEKACNVVVDIDLNEVQSIRKQLPLMSARRTDVYTMSLNKEVESGISVASVSDAYEIYYVLSKAKEKLNKSCNKQCEEGLDIKSIKQRCKEGFYYVYRENKEIVGCFCIQRNIPIDWVEEKEYTYLSSLCLLPEYQGRGLGKMLLKAAIDNSTKVIYLNCWNGADELKEFYTKNGFKYVRDEKENDYYISIFKKE